MISQKDKLNHAKIQALEKLLIATGRWTKDSSVELIALSSNPYDRLIADHVREYYDKLSDEAKEKWYPQ